MTSTSTIRRSVGFAALAATTIVALIASLQAVPATAGAKGGSGKEGAGGTAVTHRAGGRLVRTPALTSKAPESRLYRVGHNASEPTLGQTKNGDVFYVAFQTNTRIEVLRSKNEGQKWDIVSPKFGERNAQLLSLDPYIYVDKWTNRVFTIDLTVACAYLSFTDDGGESWTTNPLACGRPVNDHQTLFSGPPVVSPTVAYDNIVYYCWNDVGSSSCSKSLDGGITFAPTGSPAFPGVDPNAGDQSDSFCGGLHGHGHVGYDGTVYVPKGHCGQPWLSISKDEGRTWERVQVAKIGIEGHEAGVAADKKGNIYYTWVGRDRLPYLAVSKNGGKKWSKPMMIAPPGVTEANLPGIDVGDPGNVAVVYMGSENSPFKPNKDDQGGDECTAVNQCTGEDDYAKVTWNGYMTMTTDAFANDPVFYSATVNDKKDPLIRNTCGPGRCRAVYDFLDIIVGPKGDVWGAFVDGCITICATPAGGSNAGSDGVVGRLVGGPKLR